MGTVLSKRLMITPIIDWQHPVTYVKYYAISSTLISVISTGKMREVGGDIADIRVLTACQVCQFAF